MLITWLARWAAVRLHRQGWRVGDTRKVFHLAIFTAAACVRGATSLGMLVAMSLVVVSVVLWSVWRGPKSPLFRALARPSDAPFQQRHILLPLFCTGLGGVLAQGIAGELALITYLMAGWGDAVGEPVGIRWGRHQYRVPSLDGLPARRSWEGTLAVWLASTLAAACGLLWCQQPLHHALWLGGCAALIEAVSPHGWDNLTLPVGLALCLFCLI